MAHAGDARKIQALVDEGRRVIGDGEVLEDQRLAIEEERLCERRKLSLDSFARPRVARALNSTPFVLFIMAMVLLNTAGLAYEHAGMSKNAEV